MSGMAEAPRYCCGRQRDADQYWSPGFGSLGLITQSQVSCMHTQ